MSAPLSRRPPLIGVSLKMYFDPVRTAAWSAEVAAMARRHPAMRDGLVSLFVLPSLPALHLATECFAGTAVELGAQDLFEEDRGAFTGAISGADLAQLGCCYVEIGHAERRRLFGDTDAIVRMKVMAGLRNGLTPLLCVGEPDRGSTEAAQAWCIAQLESALGWLSPDTGRVPLAVAYEPVWAIGQAETAGVGHVAAISGAIKAWLAKQPPLADTPVIYGGSAGPGTLSKLAGAVDGLFLGRFAHDPAALEAILDEVVSLG